MQAAIGWAQVLGVATLLIALGRGLDILVLPHQAQRLRETLLHWWDKVDNLRFANMPRAMVEGYVTIERRLFGRILSPRWIVTTLAVSGVLTTLTVYVGRPFALYLVVECQGSEQYGLEVYWIVFLGWSTSIKAEFLYPLNLGFDFVTLLTTVTLLRIFVRRASELSRYATVVTDILSCCALYYACLFLVHYYANPMVSGIRVPFLDFGAFVIQSWHSLGCTWFHVFFSSVLFSATIFFPTITYLFAILFMMLARTALRLSKWLLKHLLELSATGQRTVFFYTATFLSVLVTTVKIAYELLLLFSTFLA